MKTALVLVLVALVGSAGALGERGHERGVMEHAPPKPPPPRNAVPFSPPHTHTHLSPPMRAQEGGRWRAPPPRRRRRR